MAVLALTELQLLVLVLELLLRDLLGSKDPDKLRLALGS